MAEHIIRRGAAPRPAPRAEPRPTAELSKHELHGLIRSHAETNLEAELEIVDELSAVVPDASSPRLAHTLRRDAPPGAGAVAAPFPPDDERDDVSTIAMPRLVRPASSAVTVPRAASLPSDTERTRELRNATTVEPRLPIATPLRAAATIERPLIAPPRAEPGRAASEPRRPPAPVAGRAHPALSITLLLVAIVALAAIVALIWSAS